MKLRYLISANNLNKELDDGTTIPFSIEQNRIVIVDRVAITEDPEYIDIFYPDGVLRNVKKSFFSIYGPIDE